MRKANKLTSLAVKRASEPGLYHDGHGLYLQVSAFDTKSWIFRFMRDGVARKMGLGPLHAVTLADARQRAAAARRALLDGIDPIDARKARRAEAKLEASKAITFRECAESCIASQEAGWRNAKHVAQWKATLATYAYPVVGDLPVAGVDTGLVLKILEPLWPAKPETAGRLRGRIETVLNWATVREYRQGENPARWRGHLDGVLPRPGKIKRIKHHSALAYADLPAFMGELRQIDGISASALEFTILTAARTGEAIGAQWSEIDFAAKTWTMPAERMKASKEHKVPLSERALAILKRLPREGRYVFPSARTGKPLSNMAMLELLRGMRGTGVTVHGFRSTFRDWVAERTNYPEFVVEKALAHVVADRVEAAYRRGDLFEKRTRLMNDWAAYCASKPKAAAQNVIPMRGAR